MDELREDEPRPEKKFETMKEIKLSQFKSALCKTDGNISRACNLCNISRDTGQRMVKRNKQLKEYIADLKHSKRMGFNDDMEED